MVKKNETAMSRRTFLMGAGIAGMGAAAAGLVGCNSSSGGSASSGSDSSAEGTDENTKHFSFETEPDPIAESDIVDTVECEILVVGGGVAGAAAIARASELSDNVCVIESSASWGLPRSSTTGYNSQIQRDQGIVFDDDLRHRVILDTYMISGRYQARIDLISYYIDYSGAMIDWIAPILRDAGGDLVYQPPFSTNGSEVSTTITTKSASDHGEITTYYDVYELAHTPVGPADEQTGEEWNWVAAIGEYAVSNGARADFNMKGMRLEREGDHEGRVTACIAQNKDGEYVRYKASKGIILAAGDYMQDREMLAKYAPLAMNNFYDFSNVWCDGQMHKAAMWIGAGMDTMASLDAWPGQTITGKVLRPKASENPLWAMSYGWSWNPAVAAFPMLFLNQQGERFTNEETEDLTGCMRMANCLASVPAGGYAWSIWDSEWQSKFEGQIPEMTAFGINTPEEIEKDVEEEITYKCDTIEELAEATGMPVDALKASIDEYNAACEAGVDRKFLKAEKWLKPIDTPPYYAAGIGMGIECVRGGLTMDSKLRVTDTDGKAIEGLYAIGNTGGSFYGNVYPSMVGGTGTGHGMTFGMLAAEEIMGQSRLS